jgi:hypothetical protein
VTVLDAWAWPVVVLVVVVLLRRPLSGLIPRLLKFRGPAGLEAEFARERLEAASRQAVDTWSTVLPPALPVQPTLAYLRSEATKQPSSGIILAWSVVEQTAFETFGRVRGSESIGALVRRLATNQKVSALTPSLAHTLETLYHQVQHGVLILDSASALIFVDSAWRLAAAIRRAEHPDEVWPTT